MSYCVFCSIIARREPATILHEDDDVLVFRNVLRWLPVMLLAVPKRHLRQEELWSDLGSLGRIAMEMGRRHCPSGFRLVSNFGVDALQSQPHAHVHVLGGGSMEAVAELGRLGLAETVVQTESYRVRVHRGGWPPILMIGEPLREARQDDLWQDVGALGAELVRLGARESPYGFRLVSDVGWDALQTQSQAHIYLLGGGYLDHYV